MVRLVLILHNLEENFSPREIIQARTTRTLKPDSQPSLTHCSEEECVQLCSIALSRCQFSPMACNLFLAPRVCCCCSTQLLHQCLIQRMCTLAQVGTLIVLLIQARYYNGVIIGNGSKRSCDIGSVDLFTVLKEVNDNFSVPK